MHYSSHSILSYPPSAQVIDREDVEVVRYNYNQIVEVKPKGASKGVTVKYIIDTLLSQHIIEINPEHRPFLLCVGDDRSDEAMFEIIQEGPFGASPRRNSEISLKSGRALSGKPSYMKPARVTTFTCCVGMKPSKARYYLNDPSEVVQLLSALAGHADEFRGRSAKFDHLKTKANMGLREN